MLRLVGAVSVLLRNHVSVAHVESLEVLINISAIGAAAVPGTLGGLTVSLLIEFYTYRI